MLTNFGIKGRILLLTLLPSGLFAIILGSWFSYSQLNDLQQQLLRPGELILNQLSLLSYEPLLANNNQQLQQIAQDTINLSDVRSIRFTAAMGTILAHAGPSMPELLSAHPLQLTVHTHSASSQLTLPVFKRLPAATETVEPSLVQQPIGWINLELSHHATLLEGYRSVFVQAIYPR